MWGEQYLPTSDSTYRIFFMWVFQRAWKSHLLPYKMLLRTVTRLDKLMRPGLWEHYYFSRILCFSHILLMSLGRKSCSDICVSHRYMILMGHRVTTRVEAVFCSFKITRNGKGGTARKLQGCPSFEVVLHFNLALRKMRQGYLQGVVKNDNMTTTGVQSKAYPFITLKNGWSFDLTVILIPPPHIFKSSLLRKHLPSSEVLCVPPNAFC